MQLTRTARKVRVRRRQSIVDKGWQATEEPTLDSGFSKQLNSISPKPDTTCWSRKSRVVFDVWEIWMKFIGVIKKEIFLNVVID